MEQSEFEASRSAQKKALKSVDEKRIVKAIDLIELLLMEEPGLPIVVQVGTRQFPIAFVCADDDDNIQIGI